MKPQPVLPVLLLALSSFAACGNDSRRRVEPAGGALPQDQFQPQLLEAFCGGLEPCCSEAGRPYDRAACERELKQMVLYTIDPDSDLYEYDGVKAAECVELARRITTTCLPISKTDKFCQDVYTGRRQPGEQCHAPRECAVPPGGQASCESNGERDQVCHADSRGVDGDPCHLTCFEFPDGGCVGWEYLKDEFTSAVCYVEDGLYCGAGGACTAVSALGEPCSSDVACGRNRSRCSEGRCVARGNLGDTCSGGDCVSELYCDRATQHCEPRKPAGTPCFTQELEHGCEIACDGTVCIDVPLFPLSLCNP